jgi:hypothetical protein
MSENGMSKLHSLLFKEEEKLKNVKFFPGNARGLTRDQLAGAGADMIRAACDAWRAGAVSKPPKTNVEKTHLLG